MNVLINGLNSKVGGGKSIILNFIDYIEGNRNKDYFYFILVPPEIKKNVITLSGENYKLIFCSLWSKTLLSPISYFLYIPYLAKKLNVRAIINLGDLIINTKINQIYLFDWAYVVYPESPVWSMMRFKEYTAKKIKAFIIKLNVNNLNAVICQSDAMALRLKSKLGLEDCTTFPNPVPSSIIYDKKVTKSAFKREDGVIYLTYLTRYYVHKNIEILLDVAPLLDSNKFKFVLTLSEKEHPNVVTLLKKISDKGLQDSFINLGEIDYKCVPNVISSSDGLIMPTLLESYGLPYVEFMANSKTVLTSDLDFSRSVCKSAAFYFDPADPECIASTIRHAFNSKSEIDSKILIGTKVYNRLSNWDDYFQMYINKVDELISRDKYE